VVRVTVGFDSDVRAAFGVITDLVNSDPARGGAGPLQDDVLDAPESFRTLASGFRSRHDLTYEPEGTRAELVEMRRLRARLEEFLRLTTLPERLTLINSLLIHAGSTPQLAVHDGGSPHFHYTLDDAPYASKLVALTSIGLARLVTADAVDRYRVCEGPDCSKVFVDVSKNGSRRYCDSQSCGNRLHAARYRARKSAAAGA
jgi:predicted RNA-binding Zn ribbon-like protein